MQLRKLLSCLLLLSAALVIVLIPDASSQQFTTSTAFLTSTLTQTLTSNSASQIYIPTLTTFETITNSPPVWSVDVNGRCSYVDAAGWFLVSGPEFSVHVTYSASEPVILYILPGKAWNSDALVNLAADPCNPEGSVYHNAPSSSGSFDVSGLLPSDGPFVIWVVAGNEPSPTDFTVSYLSVKHSFSTVTSYVAVLSETSVTILVSSLQTIGVNVETSPLQMPQPPQQTATQSNNIPQLALGAVIVAVVIAAVFLFSRRKGQPVKKTEKVEPEAKKATSQEAVVQTEKPTPSKKNFCIECGNELPPKSKFCNNCGTKQA